MGSYDSASVRAGKTPSRGIQVSFPLVLGALSKRLANHAQRVSIGAASRYNRELGRISHPGGCRYHRRRRVARPWRLDACPHHRGSHPCYLVVTLTQYRLKALLNQVYCYRFNPQRSTSESVLDTLRGPCYVGIAFEPSGADPPRSLGAAPSGEESVGA